MSITPEQRESLEQLLAVTASESQAAKERDERMLRENGWDVQVRPGLCDQSFLSLEDTTHG